MAESRNIRRNVRRLQRVKTWQLVAVLLLLTFITATFLRLNNIGMVQRRDAVLQADKGTDTAITQTRLYDLQRYVSSHMNADMGTIYLENQYKRDSQKTIEASSQSGNTINRTKEAQAVCGPRYANLGGYSQAYEQCMLSEINNAPGISEQEEKVQLPKPDLYRISFASPVWSPDFAGFSVLSCLLIILVIFARLGALLLLKFILKIKHRGV